MEARIWPSIVPEDKHAWVTDKQKETAGKTEMPVKTRELKCRTN